MKHNKSTQGVDKCVNNAERLSVTLECKYSSSDGLSSDGCLCRPKLISKSMKNDIVT